LLCFNFVSVATTPAGFLRSLEKYENYLVVFQIIFEKYGKIFDHFAEKV